MPHHPSVVAPRTVSRRTVLTAGAGAAGAVALAAAVGVPSLVRRSLPLTVAALAPLVGTTFVEDGTGRRLELAAVDAADDARFTLRFTADGTDDLPSATRTLHHADGDLLVHLGPVGPEGRTLEAVVDRSA